MQRLSVIIAALFLFVQFSQVATADTTTAYANDDSYIMQVTGGTTYFYPYYEAGDPVVKSLRMGKGTYPMDAHFTFDISDAAADSIESATLRLYCLETRAKTIDLRFYGYNADSTIAVTDTTQFLSVLGNLTTAYEDTSLYYPYADTWYEFDVTGIVSELSGRTGWTGHTIIVALDNNSESSGYFRTEAVEDSSAHEAQLVVIHSTQQGGSGTGAIAGTVSSIHDSTAVVGATVTVSPGDYTDTTDGSGNFFISDIPDSITYSISVTKSGFLESSASNITITENDTTIVDFYLTSADSTTLQTQSIASADGFLMNSSYYYPYIESGDPVIKSVRMGMGSYPMDAYFTFDVSDAVDAGSIESAILKLYCRETRAKTINLQVYAYDADSTVTIDDVSSFTSVLSNLTTASKDTSLYYPYENTWYEIDVTTVIAELLSRENWTGHTIIVVKDNNSESSGYLRAEATEDTGSNAAQLDVTYSTALVTGSIAGVISDIGDSSPVVGAIINVSPGDYTDTTDEYGAYLFPGLSTENTYEVEVTATDYGDSTQTNITVTAGDTTEVNFSLEGFGSIAGTITDSNTSAAIENAYITVNPGGYADTTDVYGNYCIQALSSLNTYTVSVSAYSYNGDNETNVSLDTGDTTDVDFDLAGMGTLAGTITSIHTTQPVPNAIVSIQGISYADTTDANGDYSIYMPVGSSYTAEVSAPNYQNTSNTNVTITWDTTTDVDFSLTSSIGTISGYITDASTSSAINNAEVTVSPGDYTGYTNASGLYSIPNVLVQSSYYTVTVSKDEYYDNSLSNVTVSPNDTTSISLCLSDSDTEYIKYAELDGYITDFNDEEITYYYQGAQYKTIPIGNESILSFFYFDDIASAVTNADSISSATLRLRSRETVSGTANIGVQAYYGPYVPNMEYQFVIEHLLEIAHEDSMTDAYSIISIVDPQDDEWYEIDVTSIISELHEISSTAAWSEVMLFMWSSSGAMYPEATDETSSSNQARLVIEIPNPEPSPVGGISGTVARSYNGYSEVVEGATVSVNGDSVTTGSNGNYLIQDIPAGSGYTVTVSAAGCVSDSTSNVSVTDDQITDVNFSLAPNFGSVEGTVASSTYSTAIQGATVSLSYVFCAENGEYTDTTDQYGHYSFANVPVGSSYEIEVTKTGFSDSTQTNISVTTDDTTTVDFSLQETSGTGFIAGTVSKVYGAYSEEIEGATVTFGAVSDNTDEYGNYVFSGIPVGSSYTVEADAYGCESDTEINVSVTENDTTYIDFDLSIEMGIVAGFVKSSIDSNTVITSSPVGIAPIPFAQDEYYEASTNANGYYYFENVPVATDYSVASWPTGYDLSELTNISVTKYESSYDTTKVNFYVTLDEDTGNITGTIADLNDSTVVSGAVVTLTPGGYWVETDALGNYTFSGVPVGTGYEISASRQGYIADSVDSITVTLNTTNDLGTMYIEPADLGIIAGTVYDTSDSSFVVGAEVTVTPGVGYSDITDSSGNYFISNITVDNDYTVTVTNSGYQNTEIENVAVTKDDTTLVDIGLNPTVYTGNIDGFVYVDSDSTALAGATVSIETGTAYSDTTTTDSNGYYLLEDIPTETTYNVIVNHSNCVSDSISNVTALVDSTITLPAVYLIDYGWITGTAYTLNSKDYITEYTPEYYPVNTDYPLQKLTITVDGPVTASTLTKESLNLQEKGTFSLRVPPGTYTLTGASTGYYAPGYRDTTLTNVNVVLADTTVIDSLKLEGYPFVVNNISSDTDHDILRINYKVNYTNLPNTLNQNDVEEWLIDTLDLWNDIDNAKIILNIVGTTSEFRNTSESDTLSVISFEDFSSLSLPPSASGVASGASEIENSCNYTSDITFNTLHPEHYNTREKFIELLLHEMGHSIGLDHSIYPNVMNAHDPLFPDTSTPVTLTEFDELGAIYIWPDPPSVLDRDVVWGHPSTCVTLYNDVVVPNGRTLTIKNLLSSGTGAKFRLNGYSLTTQSGGIVQIQESLTRAFKSDEPMFVLRDDLSLSLYPDITQAISNSQSGDSIYVAFNNVPEDSTLTLYSDRVYVFREYMTVNGAINIEDDVTAIFEYGSLTINSNNVTIGEDTKLYFGNNKEFQVNVQDTLKISSGVTFSSLEPASYYWAGIDISDSTKVLITGLSTDDNAVIEYATTGIGVYANNVIIVPENNNSISIQYCQENGIYVQVGDPVIQNVSLSNILDTNQEGAIRVYGLFQNPIISNVSISNSGIGILLTNSATADLSNNHIENNSSHCIKLFGTSASVVQGGQENNILPINSSVKAVYNPSSTVTSYFNNCYWGNPKPSNSILFENPSYINYTIYSDTLFSGSGAPKMAAEYNVVAQLTQGVQLELENNWSEALHIYHDILKQTDDSQLRMKSIQNIIRVQSHSDRDFSEIHTLIDAEKTGNRFEPQYDYLTCHLYELEGDYARAISEYTQKASLYRDSAMQVDMLAQVAVIYGKKLNDSQKALEYAQQASVLNPGQECLIQAFAAADVDYDPFQFVDVYKGTEITMPDVQQDKPFEIQLTNSIVSYPNPFNPVTTINYTIAHDSDVILSVYSITGQKIAELVHEHQLAGTYSARFDGTNLSSGMYIYSISSEGFNKTGKMLLIK